MISLLVDVLSPKTVFHVISKHSEQTIWSNQTPKATTVSSGSLAWCSPTWDIVQVDNQKHTQQQRRKLHWFSWSSLGENRCTVISPLASYRIPFLTKRIRSVIVRRKGHLAVCVTSQVCPQRFTEQLSFLLEINCIKLFDCIGQQTIKLDRIS